MDKIVTYMGARGFFAAPIEAVDDGVRLHGTITAAALARRVTPFFETQAEAEAAAAAHVERAEKAIEELRAGATLRTHIGFEPDDPVLVLTVVEGEVISTATGGWSQGVTEAVCDARSEFLTDFMLRKVKVETVVSKSRAARAGLTARDDGRVCGCEGPHKAMCPVLDEGVA
jgi:hypothetical protein